jgi:hypothetical protein
MAALRLAESRTFWQNICDLRLARWTLPSWRAFSLVYQPRLNFSTGPLACRPSGFLLGLSLPGHRKTTRKICTQHDADQLEAELASLELIPIAD